MSPDDLFKRQFPDETYVPPDEAVLRKQALQRAYEIAATISTENDRPLPPAPPLDWRPIVRASNAALAVGSAAVLFLAPPEWLPQRINDVRSLEQRTLGLHVVLAAEAARVNAYRDAEGRLPASLAVAGGDARAVRYVIIDDARYTLSVSDGPTSSTYDSAAPLATLLAGGSGR
jgi:hypothetical protein